ncbi:unnamed protein product, partial [Vitis vinifera]
MGIMSAHQPSHSGDYSASQFFHVQSELISLSSQPSLPSVPSLTSQTQQQQLYLPSTTTTHHCVTTFKGHTSYVSSLALAGNFLFSGSSDKEIRLWEQNLNSELDHENIMAVWTVTSRCGRFLFLFFRGLLHPPFEVLYYSVRRLCFTFSFFTALCFQFPPPSSS